MMDKVIKKDRIVSFLDQVATKHNLIAPVEEEAVVLYRPVTSGQKVVLNVVNTTVSPKDAFFPQWETMYKFDSRDGHAQITECPEVAEQVMFGVRPCDLMAIRHLDPVFDGKFKDYYYQNRREKTIIIGVSCPTVAHTCFCTAFGGSPVNNQGADVMFYDLGDRYAVEILSDKGQKLSDILGSFWSEESDLEAVVTKKGEELAAQCKPVDLNGVKEKCDGAFDSPYWSKLSLKCINCGTCTYVCPTCHCFDVLDEGYCGQGHRYRCYDSCMYSDFNLAAGGHNPRPGKKERVRNRFLHKLKYHLDRYGLSGCVGCGRCIYKCPVNVDITQVISDLKAVD